MEQNNWRSGDYLGEENTQFNQPPGDSMAQYQPSFSDPSAAPYIGSSEYTNQQNLSSFVGGALGNPLPGYDSYNMQSGQFYQQQMGMSAGNVQAASTGRYRVSQPLQGMTPYDLHSPYVSPNQIFDQPSAKKQKLNEYGASHCLPQAQPVTPSGRATRGARANYTEPSSSPLSDALLSSPPTSVENNLQSSKDSEYNDTHDSQKRSAALTDDSCSEYEEEPVVAPQRRTRGATAKRVAQKTVTPLSASKNFKKKVAKNSTPRKPAAKKAVDATQYGSLRKYFKPANGPQCEDADLFAEFPDFQRRYSALQASGEPEVREDAGEESGFNDNVDSAPAALQSDALLPRSEPQAEPAGEPEVYAHGRQPLCAALPWFQAHQGGCYRTGGITYGLLISSMVGVRDRFEEEIVITTCGGGRDEDENGNRVQMKDQKVNDNYANCMKEAKRIRQPVGLIAGQQNSISPVKLPYAFNVLSWFFITDVWMELRNGLRSWCVRFEKIDLSQPSWWMPKGKPFVPSTYTITAPTEVCDQCQTSSKRMFNIGWMCMNTDCAQYFTRPNFNGDDGLEYSTEFLQERTRFAGDPPGPLTPALPIIENGQWGTEEKYKKGIVCPKCRCCSRRLDWEEWRCENKGCDFVYRLEQRAISTDEAIADSPKMSDLPPSLRFHCDGRLNETSLSLGPYQCKVYTLPDLLKGEVAGRVYHIESPPSVKQQKDGPNQLFTQMQTEHFGLKRNAARNANKPGEIVTNHWTANHGAPYKFFVSQGTSDSFSNAPETVLKAIKRLHWVTDRALEKNVATEALLPFNEVLSVGYFQTSKMGYHDDGEKELGPTVASISFGASATMSWRPKKKNAIPGGASTAKNKKGDVLKIILRHGDVMIMDGANIQRYYEHQIEAHGRIRFAMTCRHVRINELAVRDKKNKILKQETAELQRSATEAATMPEGHEKFDYDGNAPLPQPPTLDDAINLAISMGQIGAGQILAGYIGKEEFMATLVGALETRLPRD